MTNILPYDQTTRGTAHPDPAAAPYWSLAITPAAAQVVNASHRFTLTTRPGTEGAGESVEGVLPHVLGPGCISLYLPRRTVKALSAPSSRGHEGVITIGFGVNSELVLYGSIDPASAPAPIDGPAFERVDFQTHFLAVVARAATTGSSGARGDGLIFPMTALESEAMLARSSQ
jgi:hypothetical protein